MACVDLPAFPLQLLLKQHPDWTGRPVAVVDHDRPQGVIRWINEPARAARIRPGMRYGAGRSLARTLHAGEVSPAEIEQARAALLDRLHRFSPEVEPCREEPGVFWLNASGLSHLYRSPRQWAGAIETALRADGFEASIAVGFTRFGSYAIARTLAAGPAVAVVRDQTREREWAGQAPLDRLGVGPSLRGGMRTLGVRTVRAFLQLPAAGIRRRFGPEAHRLYRLAAGDLSAPLQPSRLREPLVECLDFDNPETETTRLLFSIKRLLNRWPGALAARHETLAEVTLHLRLDRTGCRTERVRPAEPTVDITQVMNLIRLRLEGVALASGVTALRVTARAAPATTSQQGLFAERPRRDFGAARRALARIRAEFGDAAVVRARLAEAHLPEARFRWEPVDTVARPEPAEVATRPMVRRLHAPPRPWPSPPRHQPDGWMGPYLVSGGWWRSLVQREYYFAPTRAGDLLWVYYDRRRRRWCWQGQVE